MLVDTKYEFGTIDGQLVLIDEVHTPDSSRYWTTESYERALTNDEAPEGFSKEMLREWFKGQGFSGEGPIPAPPAKLLAQAAQRYMTVYERLTGEVFTPGALPAASRISTHVQDLATGVTT